jgi:hypothetical protein
LGIDDRFISENRDYRIEVSFQVENPVSASCRMLSRGKTVFLSSRALGLGSGHINILKNWEKTPKNTSISVRFKDVFKAFFCNVNCLAWPDPSPELIINHPRKIGISAPLRQSTIVNLVLSEA